jgi:hypothetical protein
MVERILEDAATAYGLRFGRAAVFQRGRREPRRNDR